MGTRNLCLANEHRCNQQRAGSELWKCVSGNRLVKCNPSVKGAWREKEPELHIYVSFPIYQHCWFKIPCNLQEILNTFP